MTNLASCRRCGKIEQKKDMVELDHKGSGDFICEECKFKLL